MADPGPIRFILELDLARQEGKNRKELLALYDAQDIAGLRAWIDRHLGTANLPYRIVELPSLAPRFVQAEDRPLFREDGAAPVPERLVFGLWAADEPTVRRFERLALDKGEELAADARIGAFDSWCPGEGWPPLFATRARAEALIGAAALSGRSPPLKGARVNVVVVDDGLSVARLRQLFPGLRYAGGWRLRRLGEPDRLPGAGRPDGHGTMVARNLLSLAPEARLFDLPMLPDRIRRVPAYIGWAHGVLSWVQWQIRLWRAAHQFARDPWVFCHAWGIYDRRSETVPGAYTNNPRHPFNRRVGLMDQDGHDQVFAAGNCGQFCPNARCGPGDRGPGESILGANSHPRVLTVGAVRADGLWLGYSSQGPGQEGFLEEAPRDARQVEKPDLCAPSHFVEAADGHALSSGTSAACGLAAGAVAALRSAPKLAGLDPEKLRALLRDRACRPAGAGWDPRLGHGILDLRRMVAHLAAEGLLP
ncbi:S8 family serine peptidase [Crenalkalicoccus roseus]|uniref:S8 family serine peptidase n=1 Tax=Crenalkalicoccus roseus TaxID=1485588 RepID=UPI0013052CA6|nr:S8 family serine peptidase [Crenalkalicoccus roseus]